MSKARNWTLNMDASRCWHDVKSDSGMPANGFQHRAAESRGP